MISRTLRGRIYQAERDTSTTTFQRTCYWLGEWQSIARALVAELEAAPPSAPVGVEADALIRLVEGPGCLRWQDGQGFRLKDTPEWMAFYVAAKNALAQQPAACPKCDGAGEADSGGIMPWGAPATIPCDCQQPAAVGGARRVMHELCDCPNGRAEHASWCAALAQQPATVDGAVERLTVALTMYDQNRTTMKSLAGAVGDFLRDYRAAQPGGSDNG